MADSTFKRCAVCGTNWDDQAIFLVDPALNLVGYQVCFETMVETGYLLFNHSCGNTLAVPVKKFQDLPQGSAAGENMADEEKREDYCLHEDDRLDCPAGCKCGHVKEIIKIIKAWPKREDE